ncbi:hypothetical protein [Azospirillum melinis]
MGIASVSVSTASSYAGQAGGTRPHHHGGGNQNLRQLASSLQSGDLSGAQKAFDGLQQANANGGSSNARTQALSQNSNYKTLQDALSSGDLAGAQKAFGALQQDMKSARGERNESRENDGDKDDVGAASSSAASSSASGAGLTINISTGASGSSPGNGSNGTSINVLV